jgi:uncharacterized membrane protein
VRFQRALILSAWVLMLVIAVGILAANVYVIANGIENDTLLAWGSSVIGFLFGSLITMVRDFMRLEPNA